MQGPALSLSPSMYAFQLHVYRDGRGASRGGGARVQLSRSHPLCSPRSLACKEGKRICRKSGGGRESDGKCASLGIPVL